MYRDTRSRGAVVLELALALPLALGLIYATLAMLAGTRGLVEVSDSEVAVVVDYRSGQVRVVDQPGIRLFIPWLQEVHRFDKSPDELRLQEGDVEEPGTRPRLLVRARDGSSFWFKTYTIQYALRPEEAARVLRDSGPGDGFKGFLINTFARSVLRDEFGRYGVDEIVDPANLSEATRRSHEQLDRLLAPHGLRVVELSAPNPGFDPDYERAIERRKVHNQQVAYLAERLTGLEPERARRLAEARKESELEQQEWATRLSIDLLGAEEKLIQAQGEAEAEFEKKVESGRAARAKKLAQAQGRRASILAEVNGLQEEIAAFEAGGEILVRRELVNRLAGIPFKLAPYSTQGARSKLMSLEPEVEGTR
jgi:regulator of protease activity HflC (stomatin/prohibitin superfamily)